MKDLINWLNFRNMIAPTLIRGLFWALSVVLIFMSIGLTLLVGFGDSWDTALLTPFAFGFLWVAARIATEFVLVIFGIHDELKEMNDGNQ